MLQPIVSSPATSFSPSFRISREASGLSSIYEPAVNVAVWKREISDELKSESMAWAEHAHEVETIVDAHAPFPNFLAPELPAGGSLLADIAYLFDLFVRLSGASKVQLFIGAVRNDQCRKFHQDYIRLRLLNTYFGPGTEWVPEDGVCREALDQHCSSVTDANRQIVPNPGLVRHAQRGDVVVLKGTRFPGNDRGAIHRSPPIAECGLTRVVLTLTTYDK